MYAVLISTNQIRALKITPGYIDPLKTIYYITENMKGSECEVLFIFLSTLGCHLFPRSPVPLRLWGLVYMQISSYVLMVQFTVRIQGSLTL